MFRFLFSLFSLRAASPARKWAGFYKIDIEEEASRLRLENHGRSDGARDVPPSDAERPGVIENQIILLGKDQVQANAHHYEQEYSSYVKRLETLTPEGMLQQAQMQIRSHLNDIESLPTKFEAQLSAHRKRYNDAQQKLRLFQHDNGLEDRNAHYPESKLLHFSVIAVILLAESFMNTTLLAQGNELGLLGGWTEAILFSLINGVVLGIGLCFFTRFSLSVKLWNRSFAILGVVALILVAIAFNLAVAHYRNALSGEFPESASTTAWTTLLESPFKVGDIKSLMLFLLGVGVVIFAAVDWFKMDDPYPGYGRVSRAYVDALGQLQSYHGWLVHEKLDDIRTAASEVIADHLSKAASAASEDSNICSRIKTLNERYTSALENTQSAINSLLQIYRQANMSSRNTNAPNSFDRDWISSNEIEIQPLPQPRQLPNPSVYEKKLKSLQDELNTKYQTTLRLVNEYSV